MTLPSISVITPCYNASEFIEDALLSVHRQGGVAVEHIVVDGASTDSTREIVKRYPTTRWLSESDHGQSDAINKGFLRATGDLVGWLNADDYYLPGALAAISSATHEHPEADVIYGDCVFVDREGKILRSKVEHEFDRSVLMYFGCYIPSTSTFFRRRVIESGLLLDCDYRVCMDFEFFARLANAGLKFHYVPQVVAGFRWHGSNVSTVNAGRRAEERLRVQRRFGWQHLPESTLGLLSYAHRAKRLVRKAASGNLSRELRLRQMIGCQTRWFESRAAHQTCQKLACL